MQFILIATAAAEFKELSIRERNPILNAPKMTKNGSSKLKERIRENLCVSMCVSVYSFA